MTTTLARSTARHCSGFRLDEVPRGGIRSHAPVPRRPGGSGPARMPQSCPRPFVPADHNAAVWRLGAWVSAYDDRRISPAEALLLLRYREPLSGRVLELGPGAGRFTEYLAELAGELTALEISPDMAEVCRRRVPSATVRVGDMEDLAAVADGRWRPWSEPATCSTCSTTLSAGRCWPSCIAFSFRARPAPVLLAQPRRTCAPPLAPARNCAGHAPSPAT